MESESEIRQAANLKVLLWLSEKYKPETKKNVDHDHGLSRKDTINQDEGRQTGRAEKMDSSKRDPSSGCNYEANNTKPELQGERLKEYLKRRSWIRSPVDLNPYTELMASFEESPLIN